MSGFITDEITSAWNTIKSAFSGIKTAAETELSVLETQYLPRFHAFLQQMEGTVTQQGIQILEQEGAVIGTAFITGGNIGEAIASTVPQVMAEVRADSATDLATTQAAARNAAYTGLGLILAALPQQAAPADAVTPQVAS